LDGRKLYWYEEGPLHKALKLLEVISACDIAAGHFVTDLHSKRRHGMDDSGCWVVQSGWWHAYGPLPNGGPAQGAAPIETMGRKEEETAFSRWP